MALFAAGLPLLTGVVGVLRGRVRVGLALGAFSLAAFAAVLVHASLPLPSGEPTMAAPVGLQLPPASGSWRSLRGAARVAVTPEALWLDGAQVERAALVRALNEGAGSDSVLPLLVDERVPFSTLRGVLRAAGEANRHVFAFVVRGSDATPRVLRFQDLSAPNPEPETGLSIHLAVSVSTEGFHLGMIQGELDPIPLDWGTLNLKVAEVKTEVPGNQAVRVAAADDVTVGLLVKTLEAVSQHDGAVMHPVLVVGGSLEVR